MHTVLVTFQLQLIEMRSRCLSISHGDQSVLIWGDMDSTQYSPL